MAKNLIRILFKKTSLKYIVFPQLFLSKTLKSSRKWVFFVATILFLPYNLVILSLFLSVFILAFAVLFSLEICKNIFKKL